MILRDLIGVLEKLIPAGMQESYDNTGLQIGNTGEEVTRALICMDVTMGVLEEAVTQKCDLVISHHPMIFKPIKKLDFGNEQGLLIAFAVKHNLAVYSMHTSIDKYRFGVSYALARKLNLENIQTLKPEEGVLRKLVTFCPSAQAPALRNALFSAGAGHIGNYDSCSFNIEGEGSFRALEGTNPYVGKQGELHSEKETRIEVAFPDWNKTSVIKSLLANHPYEEVAYDIYPLENSLHTAGLGAVGYLKKAMGANDFLSSLQSCFGNMPLKYCTHEKMIKRVAVCGGSGASLLGTAVSAGADAYITGDIKYHDFQAASGKILLADAGHYETEIQVLQVIKELISEKIPTFATLISETNTNFVKYLK